MTRRTGSRSTTVRPALKRRARSAILEGNLERARGGLERLEATSGEAVMNVRDIPRAQWPAFLDHFSRTHRAWLATVDAGSSAPDDRNTDPQDVAPHPLGSITPFVYNDYVVHIDIRFQDEDRTHDSLRVVAPGTVRVDETPEGVAQVLEIVDGKGLVTRIRFRAAPRAEMLDGVAPGEFS